MIWSPPRRNRFLSYRHSELEISYFSLRHVCVHIAWEGDHFERSLDASIIHFGYAALFLRNVSCPWMVDGSGCRLRVNVLVCVYSDIRDPTASSSILQTAISELGLLWTMPHDCRTLTQERRFIRGVCPEYKEISQILYSLIGGVCTRRTPTSLEIWFMKVSLIVSRCYYG